MDSVIVNVCNYINEKYLSLESASHSDEIQYSIEQVLSFGKALEKAFNNNFEGIDFDEVNIFNDSLVLDYNFSPSKLISYARLIQYDPESEIAQYRAAKEEIKNLISINKLTLRSLRKQLDESQNSLEKDKLKSILKIFKQGYGAKIKLSGNIKIEDFNYIKQLLDEMGLEISDKIEFIRELDNAIHEYKFKFGRLSAAIEKDNKKQEFEKITTNKDKETKNYNNVVKIADYKYKRIFKVIENLKNIYNGELDNPPIDENTPFDKNRIKLYYSQNNDGTIYYDFNIVLYDLINYINPNTLEKKVKEGKLSPKDLDYIRNNIYKDIINKYKSSDLFDKEEPTEDQEEIIKVEPEEIIKAEPEYINEKVKYLDEKEKEVVETAKIISYEFGLNNAKLSQYHDSYLERCLYDMNFDSPYDKEILEFEIYYQRRFKNSLENYENTYNELLRNREFAGDEYLEFLENDKEELLEAANKLINKYELIKENSEETEEILSDDVNNIILFYSKYTNGKTEIPKDFDEIKRTGQIKQAQIEDAMSIMRRLINVKFGPNIKKVKKEKYPRLKQVEIFRYRKNDVRFIYIPIYINEYNAKILKEKFDLNTDNFKIFLTTGVIYKKGNNAVYDIVLRRMNADRGIDENDVDSLLWIKNIFINDFTENTKQIAFDLIENSLSIRNTVIKGGEQLGTY